MKKFIVAVMTVLFLGSTGLVLADDAAPVTTPVAKVMKHKAGKKVHKAKKAKKMKKEAAAPAASTTPEAK